MEHYDTLLDALNGLRSRGFTADFNLEANGIRSLGDGSHIDPATLEVVEFYRFEGESDPDDEAVVFALESPQGRIRGVLVSAFGPYCEPLPEQFIAKLRMAPS